jgi:HK97 gp10 family phage protein
MAEDFSLIGIESLSRTIAYLQKDMKNKIAWAATRKGANFVAAKAREGAKKIDNPKTVENIEKNIAVRRNNKRHKATGDIAMRVGVLGGAGGNNPTEDFQDLPGKDTRHWRFEELGSENNVARPFLRPALQNHVSEVINIITTELEKGIDRAVKRDTKQALK